MDTMFANFFILNKWKEINLAILKERTYIIHNKVANLTSNILWYPMNNLCLVFWGM